MEFPEPQGAAVRSPVMRSAEAGKPTDVDVSQVSEKGRRHATTEMREEGKRRSSLDARIEKNERETREKHLWLLYWKELQTQEWKREASHFSMLSQL